MKKAKHTSHIYRPNHIYTITYMVQFQYWSNGVIHKRLVQTRHGFVMAYAKLAMIELLFQQGYQGKVALSWSSIYPLLPS